MASNQSPFLSKMAISAAFLLFLTGGGLPVSQVSPLDQIIGNIEGHQRNWIQLQAHLQLEFLNAYEQGATCEGKLTYHRLREKMILNCFNETDSLMFAFKTSDSDFEMYLPAKKTLFKGNIFDLENSKEIDSHLQPLQLYRALKTFTIPKNDTEIENWGEDTVALRIFGRYGDTHYLTRRLISSPVGEVFTETFYNMNQQPITTISRSDFKLFRNKTSTYTAEIRFPHQIKIESSNPHDHRINATLIQFHQVGFLQSAASVDDNFQIPPDTEIIYIQ